MNTLRTAYLLAAALLVVFWESAFDGIRALVGAQVDLLPPLAVYAALKGSLTSLVLLALVGGLGLDSLSANPLGTSVLPLFLIGLVLHVKRDLILRDQVFAQFVLGLVASAAAPVLSLLLLLTGGIRPLVGWGTAWQILVMCLGGALATPVFFELFGWLDRALSHAAPAQSSFRHDREIRRGR